MDARLSPEVDLTELIERTVRNALGLCPSCFAFLVRGEKKRETSAFPENE